MQLVAEGSCTAPSGKAAYHHPPLALQTLLHPTHADRLYNLLALCERYGRKRNYRVEGCAEECAVLFARWHREIAHLADLVKDSTQLSIASSFIFF